MDRREALLSFLNGALQAAGTVLLASSAVRAAPGGEPAPPAEGDLQKRADRLASEAGPPADGEELTSFLNFRNGGFRNGGFRNGGWRNGGWRNGGWRNGGFRNGGWYNGGWHNGWRNY